MFLCVSEPWFSFEYSVKVKNAIGLRRHKNAAMHLIGCVSGVSLELGRPFVRSLAPGPPFMQSRGAEALVVANPPIWLHGTSQKNRHIK